MAVVKSWGCDNFYGAVTLIDYLPYLELGWLPQSFNCVFICEHVIEISNGVLCALNYQKSSTAINATMRTRCATLLTAQESLSWVLYPREVMGTMIPII